MDLFQASSACDSGIQRLMDGQRLEKVLKTLGHPHSPALEPRPRDTTSKPLHRKDGLNVITTASH